MIYELRLKSLKSLKDPNPRLTLFEPLVGAQRWLCPGIASFIMNSVHRRIRRLTPDATDSETLGARQLMQSARLHTSQLADNRRKRHRGQNPRELIR